MKQNVNIIQYMFASPQTKSTADKVANSEIYITCSLYGGTARAISTARLVSRRNDGFLMASLRNPSLWKFYGAIQFRTNFRIDAIICSYILIVFIKTNLRKIDDDRLYTLNIINIWCLISVIVHSIWPWLFSASCRGRPWLFTFYEWSYWSSITCRRPLHFNVSFARI